MSSIRLLVIFSLVGLVALKNTCMYIDYRGENDQTNYKCAQHKMCKRNYIISRIAMPPYSTAQLLEKVINRCCGNCTILNTQFWFRNISEVSLETMEQSDFILPFLGKSSAVTLYGYHFLPLTDVPSAFYFTPKRRSILAGLIINCLNLYPLIVVCLLMAVISGFIAWSLETWYNKEDFPRTFLTGLFEGFWWSFVSMTTVGYGDKTIRSVPARIFSVLWILIGIAMFGLLTALLTAEIMKAMEPHKHITMAGAKIGALKYRDYDASLIVKRGGVIKETKSSDAWEFHSDILGLMRMLRLGDIDGMVLDKYTLAYAEGYFKYKMTGVNDMLLASKEYPEGEPYDVRKEDINFFRNFTYKTQKSYEGEKFSYGVLVKDQDVYEYFRDAVRDNRLSLDTSAGSAMNELFPKISSEGIFTTSGTIFLDTALALAGILCGICLFGILYELYSRKKLLFTSRQSITKTPNGDAENSMMNNNVDVELLKNT